jgi:hypothetical protein
METRRLVLFRSAVLASLGFVACNQIIGNDKERVLYTGGSGVDSGASMSRDAGASGTGNAPDATGGNSGGASAGGAAGSAGAASSGGAAGVAGGSGAGGTADTGGSTGAGGASASGGGTSGSGGNPSTGGAGTADAGPPACDPKELPGDGIFVSATNGDDTAGSGTPDLPLRTIQKGLAAAAASAKSTLYLDEGTYKEPVSIGAANTGVTLRGGFVQKGTVWQRDCSGIARGATVIASPTAVGVRITDVTTRVTLRTLTVLTRSIGATAAGAPGESCYGVFVSGDASTLELTDVTVTAGAGGDGGAVSAVINPPPATCDGFNDCSTGKDGSGGGDGPAAQAGTFSSSGYAPGNGSVGTVGNPGANGTKGGDGAGATCHLGSGCSGGAGPCSGHFCGDLTGTGTVQSGPGKCGCGGPGGAAGLGGEGGGASIALFVAGTNAAVSVTGSTLTAKAGGHGSSGAAGSNGGAGAAGSVGTAATCWGACQSVGSGTCNCEQPATYTITGGTAGGSGGTGGPGGKGGGGAGGASVAIVRIGGALVSVDATSTVTFGPAGTGANGAAIGVAQREFVQ